MSCFVIIVQPSEKSTEVIAYANAISVGGTLGTCMHAARLQTC